MLPSPPDLSTAVRDWRDRELFWIVKHGIKYTGMPAWVAAQRDDEVWAIVAFLRRLPTLDAAGYRELALGGLSIRPQIGREIATTEDTSGAMSACAIGTDATLPPGDHWFACTLSVSSNRTLTIPAGNVVVTGGVDVQGTLIVNTSDEDHWFVIRNGDLDRGGSSSLDLGNEDGGVFVYLQNGRINTQGGGDQTSWIAPHAGPFEDLALWSDSPETHEMLGSSALSLEGVFYIPNASFSFGGGGTMTQQDAQFIVYRFHTHGGGALRMVPNPERNIGDPRLSVALIR
jgi:hypothetical protein